MMDTRPAVVAILNSNDDTVEMLRLMVESEGMIAVSAHLSAIRRGQVDFSGFIREHDPQVIIYDLTPPYERSWLFYKHLKTTVFGPERKVVLTSTNPLRVRQIAHEDEPILEIVGKPYDMGVIVNAVKEALGRGSEP